MRPDVDKVIFVNGQHKKDFDQTYQKDIMKFAADCPRTYLIMSPIFRGCSYMWNTCFNHTSTPYCLNLNDDVTLVDGFFDEYEQMLMHNSQLGDESFRINFSFSHFSLYRNDLFDVGYFDERLLGIGEEDGDWLWRWEVAKKKSMRVYRSNCLINHIDTAETNVENMVKAGGKYSKFNADWIFSYKYQPDAPFDPSKPSANSLYGRHIQMRDGAMTPEYYPAEKWYRENINRL
jgi:GR25 family glycosyltransferase involved in LPS biosynthesis